MRHDLALFLGQAVVMAAALMAAGSSAQAEVIGKDDRLPLKEFAKAHGLSMVEFWDAFGASGRIVNSGWGTAQVVGRNDLILTAAHNFYTDDCELIQPTEDGRYFVTLEHPDIRYELDMDTLWSGGCRGGAASGGISDGDGVSFLDGETGLRWWAYDGWDRTVDWVIVRLKTPVLDVTPYEIPQYDIAALAKYNGDFHPIISSQRRDVAYGDSKDILEPGVRLIHLSQGDNDFRRKGTTTRSGPLVPSATLCEYMGIRRLYGFYQSNCDTYQGSSGGAALEEPEGFPNKLAPLVVLAIHVASRGETGGDFDAENQASVVVGIEDFYVPLYLAMQQ
jgi:hypothetical protein